MYTFLRLRSQQSISEIIALLEEMALTEHRGYRALTTPDIPLYTSTASAPSLRARDIDPIAMDRMALEIDAGNVKVVVRVRKFIQRGMRQVSAKETDLGLTRL